MTPRQEALLRGIAGAPKQQSIGRIPTEGFDAYHFEFPEPIGRVHRKVVYSLEGGPIETRRADGGVLVMLTDDGATWVEENL